MNTGFYEDLDTNFELAYALSGRDFTHKELISFLKNGNIPEKQIAALKIEYIDCKEDAEALINNLTGCDGKIREAVAQKLNHIICSNKDSRKLFMFPDILADATIDINSNICRLVVDSAKILGEDAEFAAAYIERIITFIHDALDELDKFIFRDKKYVINKQLFKLYWCLETLQNFYNFTDENTLYNILLKCAAQNEYTIREKTAQILFISGKFSDLAEKLCKDENYYVRAVFKSS